MIRSATTRTSTNCAVAVVLLGVIASGVGAVEPARAADPSAPYAHRGYGGPEARLMRRAEAGDARAQGLLGFLYEQGRGVPQNFELAAMWYACAAERGDVTAQYLLGMLYDKGRGVPLDAVLSHKWLILAAARTGPRDRDAYARIRDAVASKMSESQRALAQAMATAWEPVPPAPVRW